MLTDVCNERKEATLLCFVISNGSRMDSRRWRARMDFYISCVSTLDHSTSSNQTGQSCITFSSFFRSSVPHLRLKFQIDFEYTNRYECKRKNQTFREQLACACETKTTSASLVTVVCNQLFSDYQRRIVNKLNWCQWLPLVLLCVGVGHRQHKNSP